ncbi:sensor histidine kinase [Catenulispora rubra]|uniref:sensor histidine kinase n=1 Tax=Catenulispora rubra TaxID=280293 RepID=UPI0018927A80|nr:histidine kinase [Catenulispora rubra]
MPTTRENLRIRWGEAGWDALFLVSGLPLWAGSMVILMVGSQPLYLILNAANPGIPRFVVSVLVVPAVVLTLAPILTSWQRSRFRAFRSVEIHRVETPRLYRGQVRQGLRSEALWRQTLYHLIAGPLIGLTVVGLAFMDLVAVVVAVKLPPHALGVIDPKHGLTGKFWGQCAYLLLAGTVTYFGPRLIRLLAAADLAAARRLLGPSETIVLANRVQTLSDSRAAAVEAADAERRRIERDLHDGAQQRLMSLAVHLGIARKTLKERGDVPPEAMSVIIDAHEQVKDAMAEIRNLVRGLHPAVLDDRGLDAALSGVAARSAVPVRLTVGATGPLSASVETVAYFVVSEALANVVKHSRAKQAAVDVSRRQDHLLIRVTDDGVGGADAQGGTGLTGLAQRVASVDGRLRLTSPSGGPTVLTAELPCGV